MLTDDILKALVEGIIYVAPEPVTLEGILKVLEGEERERVKAKLDELVADYEQNTHGIQIRQVANGYKFSTKAEHHEILRKYVKSLKPLVRLSKPALETLAVLAYRQPVTMPEIEEIRGVDSGGVIHTLLEKKLVVTAGRKSVVGRPILYRTSKDFLVHFGLKDVGELPSLKEFEELAKRALGSEWVGGEPPAATGEAAATPVPDTGATTAEAETSPHASPPAGEGSAPVLTTIPADNAGPSREDPGTVSIDETPVGEPVSPAAEASPAPLAGGEESPARVESASAEPPSEPKPSAGAEVTPENSPESPHQAGESTEN